MREIRAIKGCAAEWLASSRTKQFQKVDIRHSHMHTCGVQVISPRLKLWRLEYASTDDSEVCPKEWSDEGIFDETRARQLGGGRRDLMRRQSDGSWERRW